VTWHNDDLRALMAAAPAEPLLVWCGNGHASKNGDSEWGPGGAALPRPRWHRPVRHRPDGDRAVVLRKAYGLGAMAMTAGILRRAAGG
jgi:hypothetical protein